MRQRLGQVLLIAAYVAYVWYVTQPGRPALAPSLWHGAARASAGVARVFGTVSLVCESQYWRAVA